MVNQQLPARLAARRMTGFVCACALLLGAAWLAGCGGGDDEGGGGLGGLSKRSTGGDVEGAGGPPPGPAPFARPAAVKKEDPNAPKVAPPTAEELARKQAAWEDFVSHRDSALAAAAGGESGRDAAPRRAAVPLPATPGMPANLAPRMKAWYADYSLVSTAVKLALARYTQARGGRDDPSLVAACQELRSASQRLLGDPTALASPDAAVNQPLARAYQGFLAAADACAAGQAGARDARMAAAQQSLQQAAGALHQYKLAP